MLSPIQERAIELYQSGKNLREVADEVGRSHEWVRKTLAKAGEETRSRGREYENRPACERCGKPCPKLEARFCTRLCMNKHRREAAMGKLQEALRVLNAGGTYAEAADKAGFQNAWHLWGRMHHFGLTEGKPAPKTPSR